MGKTRRTKKARCNPLEHRPKVVKDGVSPEVDDWQATKKTMQERNAVMYNNELMADVHFIVGSEASSCRRIPAHKYMLATGSSVFYAMFYGPLAEDREEIPVPDVEPEAFLNMLQYLYCGDISLKNETAVPTLYAAKKYMMPYLAELCVEHLEEEVEPSNVCLLLSQSHLFYETELMQRCWDVIDTRTKEVFQSDDFTDIDHKTLQEILGRQTLCVDETKVFDAAKRWAEAECLRQGHDPSPQQCREVLGDALYLLRFPTMTPGDFADGAGRSGLLSVQETNDLFFNFSAKEKPELRFPTTPRKGRPLCCQRFISVNTCGVIFGTKVDCIDFSVDRNISVVGFGLYGTVGRNVRNVEHEVYIGIRQNDDTLCEESHYMCPDGSSNTIQLLFNTPVQIEAGKNYQACYYQRNVLLNICGEGGKSHISCGGVNFTFTASCGNSSVLSCSTNVVRGQIPEILFYR